MLHKYVVCNANNAFLTVADSESGADEWIRRHYNIISIEDHGDGMKEYHLDEDVSLYIERVEYTPDD